MGESPSHHVLFTICCQCARQCCGTKWCRKEIDLVSSFFTLLTIQGASFLCPLECQTGGRVEKLLQSPLVSLKRDALLKKPSSSLPDLPPSCPAACTAQKLKNRTRRWRSVRDERPPAAAWRSRGSVAVGRPAAVRAGCRPARAATARKSPLVGSWEGCCCWCLERWRSLRPGCSAASHCVPGVEAPGGS